VSDTALALPETELERRYALRDVKHKAEGLSFADTALTLI
jgi:hypothetical protein